MDCPSCGTRQPPRRRCVACGAPAPRARSRSGGRLPLASRRPRPKTGWERQGRASGRLLGCLLTAVSSAVVLIALTAFLSAEAERPVTTSPVSERSPVLSPLPANPPAAPPTAAGEQVVITDEELNRQLTEYAQALSPARDVRAEIDPSGIAIRFSVYGLGGAFLTRPVARDGRLDLDEVRVEGPLGFVLDAEQVRARLASALQQHIAAEGARVEAVTLERGRLIVTLSRAGHAHGSPDAQPGRV